MSRLNFSLRSLAESISGIDATVNAGWFIEPEELMTFHGFGGRRFGERSGSGLLAVCVVA